MMRVIAFLALLLAFALGLAWIADRPGSVVVTWLGQRLELDILTAIIALLAISILLALTWSLLRLLLRLPSLMAIASRSRRKQKGYSAVSRGMVALSAGDARSAAKHASEAQKLLGAEPLALLLNAQASQLSGDGGKAEKAFNTMLDHSETRVVGLRGLYIEAQRKSDSKAARFYADEAYKLAPSADWASDAALAYRCQDSDWLGAMALVEQAASRRLIGKDTAKKQRAILLIADALDRSAREPDAALRSAQEAVKLDPTLVPAAAFLGRKTSEKGNYAKASKILETAWIANPHPDTGEAYLDVRLGDSAKDRLKRARHLLKLAPGDPESRLVLARAALQAREFTIARDNLETLVLEHPTVRACMLMAELEEADSGNMGLVREWLARASRARRDKAWVGEGRVSETWAPMSPSGKLGGFIWSEPPQTRTALLIEEMSLPRLQQAIAGQDISTQQGAANIIEAAMIAKAATERETKGPSTVASTALPPVIAPDDPGPASEPARKTWRLFG